MASQCGEVDMREAFTDDSASSNAVDLAAQLAAANARIVELERDAELLGVCVDRLRDELLANSHVITSPPAESAAEKKARFVAFPRVAKSAKQ